MKAQNEILRPEVEALVYKILSYFFFCQIIQLKTGFSTMEMSPDL